MVYLKYINMNASWRRGGAPDSHPTLLRLAACWPLAEEQGFGEAVWRK